MMPKAAAAVEAGKGTGASPVSKSSIDSKKAKNSKRFGGKLKKLFQYSILPVGLIVVWQLAYDQGLINPVTLTSPLKAWQRVLKLLESGVLLENVAASLQRVVTGFAIAAVLAIVLGIAVGWSKVMERLFDVIIQVLKPIPPIAWIPLAILWFNIGEASKLYIIFIGAFFPVFVNVVDGIRQIDSKYIEVAQIYKLPWHKLVLQVIIPGSLPSIMTGLRVGLGVAWVCVVAAELIAAESGVGYMIMDARNLAQTDTMIVGMLTIGVIGKLMDSILKKVESLFAGWR
ncbi:MAG: ssuC 11 [Paenibacillaceae bacterium]|jgi:sulfonate transport system permease protein|nr:ssuC 11 [Paenibacillaceae bacterium]